MNRFFVSLVVIVLLIAVSAVAADKPDTKALEQAGIAAAQKWLALVDAGKYAESWSEASALFKGAIAKANWEQSLVGVRKPLGALVSREVVRAEYKTVLPGAPDGEYVEIQYKTSFANKKEAVETVTPMKEKDGSWRVSGYYIK
jgi:hypothetical protein